MIHEFRHHMGYYLSLLAILFVGSLLTVSSVDMRSRILALYMTIFSYILIGIVHHIKNHDLTSKLVVEYVLIGTMTMVLVLFLL